MEKSRELSTRYIEQLTWLRGIAAFLVIISHTLRATEVKYTPEDMASSSMLLSAFDLGTFGVILFLVLSGCTLYISNSEKMSIKYIPVFYLKRFFRIWPAFVVSLVVYMIFMPVFSSLYVEPHNYWIEKQYLSAYSITDVLAYLTLTFNMAGPEGLFNNAYWSLPVEFQYYIIFPLIVFSLRSTGVIGPVLIGAGIYLLPKSGVVSFDNNIVFLLAFTFCGGVLLGYIHRKYSLSISARTGLVLGILMVAVVSAVRHSIIVMPNLPVIGNTDVCYGVAAVLIVFLALITRLNIHNRIESFLKYYGTISYSTYLYHNLFVAISVLFFINLGIHDSEARLLITFVFTSLATYFAAGLSYRYIEHPFIKIGKSYIQKRAERQRAEAVSTKN